MSSSVRIPASSSWCWRRGRWVSEPRGATAAGCWASSRGRPTRGARAAGADGPRAMVRAIQQTVEEIGAVVAVENIACDWKHGGTRTVAQSDTQLERLREIADAERRDLGEDLAWELLDADAMAARINVDGARGGALHPALRAGPAGTARRRAGGRRRAGRGDDLRVEPGDQDRAGPAMHQARTRARPLRARATEGYTADMPGEHRALLPMNSSMIVTEPLPEAEWARIGWEGAETHARRLTPLHLLPAHRRRPDRHRRAWRALPVRLAHRPRGAGARPHRGRAASAADLVVPVAGAGCAWPGPGTGSSGSPATGARPWASIR